MLITYHSSEHLFFLAHLFICHRCLESPEPGGVVLLLPHLAVVGRLLSHVVGLWPLWAGGVEAILELDQGENVAWIPNTQRRG